MDTILYNIKVFLWDGRKIRIYYLNINTAAKQFQFNSSVRGKGSSCQNINSQIQYRIIFNSYFEETQ